MSSTVQCSHCNKITTTTDNTQDIPLHIATDSSTSLEEKLYDFFQPETLEGENTYWCDTCQESCRATKTLSYTHIPTILIVHLKRLILGNKIQNHTPFNTTLEMEPYMTPGHAVSQKMKLIGIISHQGTKEHGHYVAITNRGNEWTSYNDAITTQTTLTHLHQSQAYVLMYRKMEHSAGTEHEAPRDSIMASQQLPTEKPKPSYKTHHSKEEPLLHPDPPIKIPHEKNLPRQGRPGVPETRGEGEAGGTTELDGASAPPNEKADHREKPHPEDRGPGQSENEHGNLPQSISVFLHLSQGRIEELTSLLSELTSTPLTIEMTSKWLGLEPQSKEILHDSQTKKLIDVLSEDPEDHPAGFISIIEQHNTRLKKAHLLHEATRDII